MEFKDRKPEFPGRVKLTPVSGQTDVYDMTLAEGRTSEALGYSEGTPLNKATFDALRADLLDAAAQNTGPPGEKAKKAIPACL